MAWHPTNADDVTVIVSQVERGENGERTGSTELANTNVVTVDEFSIDTEEELEVISGIGNAEGIGISKGDIEHTFSFTVMGEDADLFNGLVEDDTGRAREIELLVRMNEYKDKLTECYAGTRSLSVSDGDTTEYEVEGVALQRSPGVVSE
jgi:hypothetical protein